MEREGKNVHQKCRGEGREGLDEAAERRAGRGWLTDFRDGEEGNSWRGEKSKVGAVGGAGAVAGQARQVGARMWREDVWRREKNMAEIS